ncbi:MAG: glycosyltransferase family 4 protein [Candidatus Komeilibacteria bacterium]
MIIGLEASRANRKAKTGTEWYAWHLLQQFKHLDQTSIFNVYYNQDLEPALAQAPANFKFIALPWHHRKFWTYLRLSWELWRRPVDKFFFSNSVALLGGGEIIATIHDLGFYSCPELYHPVERLYQIWSHWLAIHRADKLIAVSQTTRDDIIRYFPKAKNKIKVIYNGWDNDMFSPGTDHENEQIRDKFNLPQHYWLYIGRLERKKNIVNLLRAYQLLSDHSWPLVLAGRLGNYGAAEILELADEIDNVRLLGYVADDDYKALLAAAGAFVFPSHWEGFGIPILEAMGSGVPVLCSALPVLQEIGADAAIYFDQKNPLSISQAMAEIQHDSARRDRLIQAGLQRAEDFSWQKCAQQTLAYIKDC